MSDKPNTSHNTWSARLRIVQLNEHEVGLLFDRWDGPPPPSPTSDFAKRWKDAWGVRGVVATDGNIDLDVC